MEYKHSNTDKNITPNSKNRYKVNKVLPCDSPFSFLPNYSTPPRAFMKIANPFEAHWRDRLHLPTFSPTVFAQTSTPNKTEAGFKWSIDDISNLKPAQIDEESASQHVCDEDPVLDSLVQDKINRYFNDKVIVPSPMNLEAKTEPFINIQSPAASEKSYAEGIAQTVLTLPPILPKHVEDALKPFFTYTKDQQQGDHFVNTDTTVYRNLFASSPSYSFQSSPPLSTGLSPIQFSPVSLIADNKANPGTPSSISEIPELNECNMSPIRDMSPGLARHLNYSEHMSVDASMVVPDIENRSRGQSIFFEENSQSGLSEQDNLSSSTVNWDIEYKNVSLLSPNRSGAEKMMDISHTNTPNSKMFTSQRKRLSESFKNDVDENIVDLEEFIDRKAKNRLFEATDAGYHTGGSSLTDESYPYHSQINSNSLFASTKFIEEN